MTSLEQAIALLEAEIDTFDQGGPQQPKDGSVDWFMLRARALGLSQLRRMQQLELHTDSKAADRFYRGCAKSFKSLRVPDPVEVDREKLPDGSLPTGVVG